MGEGGFSPEIPGSQPQEALRSPEKSGESPYNRGLNEIRRSGRLGETSVVDMLQAGRSEGVSATDAILSMALTNRLCVEDSRRNSPDPATPRPTERDADKFFYALKDTMALVNLKEEPAPKTV